MSEQTNSPGAPSSESIPVVFFGREIGDVRRDPRGASKPLLSLCIPTYNRSRFLTSLLNSIAVQIAGLGDAVEVIVSDNASMDDTESVVEAYRQRFPITYSRNRENEGLPRNLQIMAVSLARGDFTWFVGDDDLICSDGLARLIQVIRQNPDISFIFANTWARRTDEYQAKMKSGIVNPNDFGSDGIMKSRLGGDRRLNRFDELIDPIVDDVYLGSVMCAVCSTNVWKAYPREFGVHDTTFLTLDCAYPHAMVYASSMVGKPVYHLGTPVSIAFWGAQEWIGRIARLLLLRLHELLTLYQANGVDSRRIARCREALVHTSREALKTMILDPATPGSDLFSVRQYIRDNRVASHVIFEQLDGILEVARERKITNRLVAEAEELVRIYPPLRPRDPAGEAARAQIAAAFQQAMGRFHALLQQGRLNEAIGYLHMAKKAAPDAKASTMVNQVYAMLAEKGLYRPPATAAGPRR